MMRAVLILLLVAMMPGEVMAGGAVWKSKYVRVRSYVGGAWLPIVEQSVADMNAALPPRAPRLILEAYGFIPCKQAKKRNERAKRVIVICENAGMADFGHTVADVERRVIQSPVILTVGAYPDTWDVTFNATKARKLVCHELMHAVSWAPEDVGDASCLSGSGYEIVTPGPDDIAYLNGVYRRRHR